MNNMSQLSKYGEQPPTPMLPKTI